MQVFAISVVALAVGTGVTFAVYEAGFVTIANLILATISLVVPLSIGMAVLKYRLYDFGRIFKRTVTYSIVAAVLIGVYALAVVALQAVLGADDSLSVAASTLAAVATFNPVRRWVHSFVERQFDRTRYNASVEVEEFSTRILQEVDLDRLNADFAGVVDRTLRPHRMSVWLRTGCSCCKFRTFINRTVRSRLLMAARLQRREAACWASLDRTAPAKPPP